ncbi:hypothetical protein SFC65_20120 [Priestia filamentosa]|uniref:hypothetical protein n=1 Tax=Priestia filamentosa TaxID=1402861 RepID=UPI003982C026
MKRIALVTESSARKETPMKAKEFFQGNRNKWVNNIIRYLEVKRMPEEDCYFLSFYGQRILPFKEEVKPYPRSKSDRKASEGKEFAVKILDFLNKFNEKPFIELHMGKTISVPLCKLLTEYGFSYKVYAESVPLGQKPVAYEKLIEEEERKRKAKDIQRGSWKVIQTVHYQTPAEAQKILEQFESKASLYGVEEIFQELRDYLTKHYKRTKEMKKALNEFEFVLNAHPEGDQLYEFIQKIDLINDLFLYPEQYEFYKSKFGKELAKFTRYKIKQSYVSEVEKSISGILLKLSVVLLKKVA